MDEHAIDSRYGKIPHLEFSTEEPWETHLVNLRGTLGIYLTNLVLLTTL